MMRDPRWEPSISAGECSGAAPARYRVVPDPLSNRSAIYDDRSRLPRGDGQSHVIQPTSAVDEAHVASGVAHAAFPKGTLCLRIADELGPTYHDAQFADLFSTRGQPAASPARLALTSVLQYVEGLSDRQAADAVRGRIDWKYALGLELTDPGFDHTVLSEFRSRLVQGQAQQQLLDTLLDRCRERELI